MSRRLLVAGAIFVVGATALVVFVRRSDSIAAPDRRLARPQPQVSPATDRGHDEQTPSDARGHVRLDELGNVSLREVSDLLRSRTPAEIGSLAFDLEKLRRSSQTTSAVTQFFKAWAEIDPNSALQTALKFSDVGLKESALNALLEGITPSAAGQLARALADAPQGSLSPGFRSDLLGRALAKWSVAEPAAAAQFLDQHPEARVGMQGIPMAANGVALNWARIDPEAAIDWASKQPNPNGVMQGVIAGWWEKDPEAAAAYAQQHLATFEEQKLAGMIANRMAAQDPQRAAAWVAQLPAEARLTGDMDIAFAWARRDPQAASDWAMSLPLNERGAALGPIAALWSMSDPQAAGQWIASLGPGPGRDEAVGTYSGAVASRDPAIALSWAATMSNDRMREGTIQRVFATWRGRDPEAAKNWIAQSGLSPEQKSRLLGPPTGP